MNEDIFIHVIIWSLLCLSQLFIHGKLEHSLYRESGRKTVGTEESGHRSVGTEESGH